MSEPKWTKGPWKYGGYDNDVGPNDEGFWEWWDVNDSNDEKVAEAKGWGRSDNEHEANARLIAAAPEMYEALLSMHGRYSLYLGEDPWFGGESDKLVMELAEAALRKARGE